MKTSKIGVFIFMKQFFAFTYFICLFFHSFSQEKKIDSLLIIYEESKDLNIINEALQIAEVTNNPALIRKVNIEYGYYSYKKRDTVNLLQSVNNFLENYLQHKDTLSLIKYYHYKAYYFRRTYKLDSAYNSYKKSKDLALLIKDYAQVAYRLNSMGVLQNRQRDYLGAEKSLVEGLGYAESIGNHKIISSCYNNLTISLNNTFRLEEARESQRKAFYHGYEMSKKKPLSSYLNYYMNTAVNYQMDKNFKKSNEFFKVIVNDSIKQLNPDSYYRALLGLALNTHRDGKDTKVLERFQEVINYRLKVNDDIGLAIAYSLIIDYFKEKNDLAKAKYYGAKAVKYAKKTKSLGRLSNTYKQLSEIETGSKQNYYLKEYIRINDSIVNEERRAKNQFAKLRYEDEKKDIENANLKVANKQKEIELQSKQIQNIIGWSLAGFSLVFVGFGVVLVQNKNRKRAYQAKLKQVEVREQERQQIAKSLHDEVAGDIRMLHKKLVKNNLKEESLELDRVKENVRSLSHQLSSVSFDDVSFRDQIINLMSDYFDASFTIRPKQIDSVDWPQINNAIKRTLFLSIREAIQNADKYAMANKVEILFECSKKEVKVTIQDDGKGFETESIRTGIGLKNMKERLEEINGTFRIESALEKGTRITLIAPIHET